MNQLPFELCGRIFVSAGWWMANGVVCSPRSVCCEWKDCMDSPATLAPALAAMHGSQKAAWKCVRSDEHAAVVRRLLDDSDVDWTLKDVDGYTALGLATMHGCDRVVKHLLADGRIDPDQPNVRGGRTALHLAAEKQRDRIMRALLAGGARVDARDEFERTPLHLARNAFTAKILLDHGAHANARDKDGRTPLHEATNVNGEGAFMAKLMLEHGAEVDARDTREQTPLHMATDPFVAKIMLDHGAPVDACDHCMCTTLHLAVTGAAYTRGQIIMGHHI